MLKLKTTAQKSKLLLFILLFIFLLYFLFKNITASVFLRGKDRINVVFYSQNTSYYSLGFNDVNYLLTIPADTEVIVPGGYGYYRLGALGKLVSLEKKPELFKKTFSMATSSFVDLYFYPRSTNIFYGQTTLVSLPKITDIFLNKSNGNFIDRLFIVVYFIDKNTNKFKIIDDLSIRQDGQKKIFDQEQVSKVYQGYFYSKTYRKIKDNVQILYTKSFKTASVLSNIIDGEGIRVVDISQISNLGKCLVIGNKTSVTASDLQEFFDCQFKRGETDTSDIILMLGNLEKDWEVN